MLMKIFFCNEYEEMRFVKSVFLSTAQDIIELSAPTRLCYTIQNRLEPLRNVIIIQQTQYTWTHTPFSHIKLVVINIPQLSHYSIRNDKPFLSSNSHKNTLHGTYVIIVPVCVLFIYLFFFQKTLKFTSFEQNYYAI